MRGDGGVCGEYVCEAHQCVILAGEDGLVHRSADDLNELEHEGRDVVVLGDFADEPVGEVPDLFVLGLDEEEYLLEVGLGEN